jgi:hypothetical protein
MFAEAYCVNLIIGPSGTASLSRSAISRSKSDSMPCRGFVRRREFADALRPIEPDEARTPFKPKKASRLKTRYWGRNHLPVASTIRIMILRDGDQTKRRFSDRSRPFVLRLRPCIPAAFDRANMHKCIFAASFGP